MSRNIGGSVLPSSDRFVLQVKSGKFGSFTTKALPDLDTHGLFWARNYGEYAGYEMLIAMHPNGYSCDELAKRIIAAWDTGDTARAFDQVNYILDCGGMAQSPTRMESIIKGEF